MTSFLYMYKKYRANTILKKDNKAYEHYNDAITYSKIIENSDHSQENTHSKLPNQYCCLLTKFLLRNQTCH